MKVRSSKAMELATAKLASSGLDISHAKVLGIQILDEAQTAKLHSGFKAIPSLKLNYHWIDGKPMSDIPEAEPFYRIRYLADASDFGEKGPRYLQLPHTVPVAYYALNQAWGELVTDVSQPLIVTEGELKSLAACQAGFPTVGIGGVHNWRSGKHGYTWLPTLEPINWVRRHTYICFDSDFRSNPNVCLAMQGLIHQLERRGALVSIVSLPVLADVKKVGLDDFLVMVGAAEFKDLLHQAEPIGISRVLFNFNERYVYVKDPGLIARRHSTMTVSPRAFMEHLEPTEEYEQIELLKDGKVKRNVISAGSQWIRWPQRLTAEQLTYEPGQPEFVGNPAKVNRWPGWGVQPKAGNTKPFFQLVDHLFTGAEEEAKRWFLRWCAYPLKYPGTKMFSSVLIHGVRHGTGKSLIGYTLGQIYGENFAEISSKDLQSDYNEWAHYKQFIMGDDVTGGNKRQDNDALKKIITQLKLRINIKYVPTYSLMDLINYFFTSNHPDAFFLEDTDRRNFIHEVMVEPLSEEFYVEYDLWLSGGGAAHLFHELLQLDLDDFNPAAPAYRTSAKERMTYNGQSDAATWVRGLLDNPDYVLRFGDVPLERDLYTSKELLDLYMPLAQAHSLTSNGMARELARAGVRQVAKGMPIRLSTGEQGRYFAVRNRERWVNSSPVACLDHIEAKRQIGLKKY